MDVFVEGMPTVPDDPPARGDDTECGWCGKGLKPLIVRSRKCTYCGYSYCMNCCYQEALNRDGATTGWRGAKRYHVCTYCADNLVIAANSPDQLWQQNIQKLQDFLAVYGILPWGVDDRDSLIELIIRAKQPDGSMPLRYINYYREQAIPARQAERRSLRSWSSPVSESPAQSDTESTSARSPTQQPASPAPPPPFAPRRLPTRTASQPLPDLPPRPEQASPPPPYQPPRAASDSAGLEPDPPSAHVPPRPPRVNPSVSQPPRVNPSATSSRTTPRQVRTPSQVPPSASRSPRAAEPPITHLPPRRPTSFATPPPIVPLHMRAPPQPTRAASYSPGMVGPQPPPVHAPPRPYNFTAATSPAVPQHVRFRSEDFDLMSMSDRERNRLVNRLNTDPPPDQNNPFRHTRKLTKRGMRTQPRPRSMREFTPNLSEDFAERMRLDRVRQRETDDRLTAEEIEQVMRWAREADVTAQDERGSSVWSDEASTIYAPPPGPPPPPAQPPRPPPQPPRNAPQTEEERLRDLELHAIRRAEEASRETYEHEQAWREYPSTPTMGYGYTSSSSEGNSPVTPRVYQTGPSTREAGPSNAAEEDSSLSGRCVVCQDNEADMVILDCGHLSLCKDCSEVIMQTTRKCPMCRTKIGRKQHLLRVYRT